MSDKLSEIHKMEKKDTVLLVLTSVFQQRLGARAGRAAFETCSPSHALLRLATAPGLKLFFEGSLADIASNIEA